MAAQRIATTRSSDLQALSGQAGLESWGALHALLARELSPEHAALLAEPVLNPAQGTVDWYAEGTEPAQRLIDLPDQQRAVVQARLTELAADIEALAQTLSTRRTEADQRLASTVLEALRTPGLDYVYAVGSQPVLVAWSHGKTGDRAGEAWLTGQARPAPPTVAPIQRSAPPPSAVPAAVAPFGVAAAPPLQSILPPPASPYLSVPSPSRSVRSVLLLSCLPAALALALGFGIILRDPFQWFDIPVAQCRLDPGQLPLEQGLHDVIAQGGVLRAELARLSADAGRRRLTCPPIVTAAAPVPVPVPLPPTPSPNTDTRRAERQGAQSGRLQVILAWDDSNDLDLQVACPNGGGTIDFNRRNACGGTLDIDANGDVTNLTQSPVENIFFNDPAPGTYQVIVDPYGMRQHAATPFRITIRRDGLPDDVVSGVAQNGQRYRRVTSFTVTAP